MGRRVVGRRVMGRSVGGEAEVQRSIVEYLHCALPVPFVVHYCRSDVRRSGRGGDVDRMIGKWLGVVAGFPDLIVCCGGRVLFLEVKAPGGRCSGAQLGCHEVLRRCGFVVSVVRGIEDVAMACSGMGWVLRAYPSGYGSGGV